jgi:hypothetical protein
MQGQWLAAPAPERTASEHPGIDGTESKGAVDVSRMDSRTCVPTADDDLRFREFMACSMRPADAVAPVVGDGTSAPRADSFSLYADYLHFSDNPVRLAFTFPLVAPTAAPLLHLGTPEALAAVGLQTRGVPPPRVIPVRDLGASEARLALQLRLLLESPAGLAGVNVPEGVTAVARERAAPPLRLALPPGCCSRRAADFLSRPSASRRAAAE